MKKKLFLGITGYATEGKNLAATIITEKLQSLGIKTAECALAGSLKQEIRPKLIKEYGIDVLNCTPQEKELIRKELVSYGKKFRESSLGTHWTKTLEKIVEPWEEDVIIVPDLRYDFYPEDELHWIKANGILLAVTRYQTIDGQKHYIQPPNEDERANGPRLKAAADFSLEWDTLPKEELIERYGYFFDNLAAFILKELDLLDKK